MKTQHTLLEKVAAIRQKLEKKNQRAQARKDAAEWRATQKFVKAEVPKHLPVIKKRILAAAKQGENSIDMFPTGALGSALLDKLGPGFRADIDTQRYVGASDGQGHYEGPHISHTRLIWTTPS